MIFELAHVIGILPLLFLVGRWERDPKWWWVALGYGVSWAADSASHWLPKALVYNGYPLSQAGLILAAIAPAAAPRITISLTVIGCLSIWWFGIPNLWALHMAAWGTVAVLGWRCPGWLRWALVLSFGLGTIAWSWTQLQPGWAAWIAFQSTRLVGTIAVCVAMRHPFRGCSFPTGSSSPLAVPSG